jgi:very-short-patch-repair endonuclease
VIRFGIDTDGFGYHSSREQLVADAQRSNALARADDDWRVLRMTWEDLHAGWAQMLADVREVIAAAVASPPRAAVAATPARAWLTRPGRGGPRLW